MNRRLHFKKSIHAGAVEFIITCGFALAVVGIRAWGADDPRRFLAVESWRGTFGQDMSVVGSRTYQQTAGGECTVDYSLVHHLNPSGVILTNWIGFGGLRYWASDGARIPNAGNVAERATLTCPEEPPSSRFHTETADRGAVQGNFLLQIDTAANQYVIQFAGIAATITVITPDGTFVGPEIGNGWGPPVTNTLPTTGLALNGSATITLDQFSRAIFLPVPLQPADLQEVLRSSDLVVSWHLEPIVEDLEVVVELEDYDHWLPEGNLKEPDRRGNTNKVSAKLQKKGGGATSARAEEFRFELSNVSDEPGVCMNYPSESPSAEADLRFETELNEFLNVGTLTIVNPGTVRVTGLLFEGLERAGAIVSSFDFGAYGELRVTAKVPGRDPIVGYLKGDPQKLEDIPLPKCKRGSHVADAWKEKPKVNASGLADNSDSDSRPAGDGHSGDGYSLYEEYRGFSENGRHIRTNPNVKDLFILDKVGHWEVKAEISKFEKASKLKVHGQLTKDEIDEANVMNFNNGSANVVSQHGLVIVGRQKYLGYSQSVSKSEYKGRNSTPGSRQQLELDPQGIRPLVQELDLTTGVQFVTAGYLYESVAHEIGHGCSVWHHGDCDPLWVDWRSTNSLGEWRIYESPGNTPINVVPERGLLAFLPFVIDAQGRSSVLKKYLAVPHGQHSGDAACIMCYGAATVLKPNSSGGRVLLDPLNSPAKLIFCSSPQGTSFNAAPRNLFGNAHAKRGNCASQICVNDLHVGSDLHKNRDYNCEF